MSEWLYYLPGWQAPQRGPARWERRGWDELTEPVGAAQLELMLKARKLGQVTISHGRRGNAQRMAARRLVERGLLTEPTVVGQSGEPMRNGKGQQLGVRPLDTGRWFTYRPTQRGRECWLRVRSDAS